MSLRAISCEAANSDTPHDSSVLESLFNDCFLHSESTCLIGGASEPVYLPSTQLGEPHKLYYREDYFASALHEVAHWCIAGQARRQQVDFGYWYAPDGRTAAQQQAFEQVEVKPQALEWFFASACNFPFRISVDNLSAGIDSANFAFKQALVSQAKRWQHSQLPERAQVYFAALSKAFGTMLTPQSIDFDRTVLK